MQNLQSSISNPFWELEFYINFSIIGKKKPEKYNPNPVESYEYQSLRETRP